MTGSSFIFLKASLGLLLLFLSSYTMGQDKDSSETEARTDSSSMNMDAPYQRPFRSPDRIPLNLGGYLEVNSLYKEEEGISEGFSFQARRLTLFMSTPIARRISFLSEIEFEKGGEKIAIEFAALDVGFHPLFNLRTGIIMNPIGSFNQNHDGPNWEFVERPNVSERLLPATWSNAGFGV